MTQLVARTRVRTDEPWLRTSSQQSREHEIACRKGTRHGGLSLCYGASARSVATLGHRATPAGRGLNTETAGSDRRHRRRGWTRMILRRSGEDHRLRSWTQRTEHSNPGMPEYLGFFHPPALPLLAHQPRSETVAFRPQPQGSHATCATDRNQLR